MLVENEFDNLYLSFYIEMIAVLTVLHCCRTFIFSFWFLAFWIIFFLFSYYTTERRRTALPGAPQIKRLLIEILNNQKKIIEKHDSLEDKVSLVDRTLKEANAVTSNSKRTPEVPNIIKVNMHGQSDC